MALGLLSKRDKKINFVSACHNTESGVPNVCHGDDILVVLSFGLRDCISSKLCGRLISELVSSISSSA